MQAALSPDEAQIIALEALAYLAADAETLGRFLDVTGLHLDYLRKHADKAEIQAAVLDYLCRNEAELLNFCRVCDKRPGEIVAALLTLDPNTGVQPITDPRQAVPGRMPEMLSNGTSAAQHGSRPASNTRNKSR